MAPYDFFDQPPNSLLDDPEVKSTFEDDNQIADPSIVVCTILCYLGIPPALWKSAIELLLQAVAEQYRSAYGIAQAEKEFRAWKDKFIGYSVIKVIKTILEFSAEGKLSFVPVTKLAPRTVVLQKRLQGYLIEKGAKLAAQQMIAQMLRKAILVTELVFAGGCLAKCTAEAGGLAIVQMTRTVAEGVVAALEVINGVGKVANAIGVAVFVRPLLVAKATFDQSNWFLDGLSADLTRDINATFGILWLTKIQSLKPDDFLVFVSKSMSNAGIPKTLLRDISHGLAKAASAKHGFAAIFLPPEIFKAETQRQRISTIQAIESMKLYEFIQYLTQEGHLRFQVSPEKIADQELGFGQ